jgi:O-antigen/teichoic acid export membrane protein
MIRARRGSLFGATTGAVAGGIGLQLSLIVTGALAARLLGVDDRGRLALLALFPLILSQAGPLGLPLGMTYYIAQSKGATKQIVRSAAPAIAAQTCFLVVVHAAILFVFFWGKPHGVEWAAVATLASVPGTLAQTYGLAVLQGQHRFRAFNILRVAPSFLYAVGLGAAALAGVSSLFGITLVWVVSTVIAGIATVIVAFYRSPDGNGAEVPSRKQVSRFGFEGFLGSLSPVESFRIDQLIVGIALPAHALGLYVAALSFTNLPRFVAQSVGMVAYPHIASRPDDKASRHLMWKFVGVTLVICGGIAIVLEVVMAPMVRLFFGEPFAGAIPMAQILLAGALVVSIRRIVGECLKGLGRPSVGTAAEIATWVWLIPAVVIALPRWGAEGVAVATTTAYLAGLATILVVAIYGAPTVRTAELRRVGAYLGVAIASLLVGALIVFVPGSVWLRVELLVLALSSAVLILQGARHHKRRIFAPALVLGPVVLAEYVVRPMYILATGTWGWSATTFAPLDASRVAFAHATTLAVIGVLPLTAAVVYGSRLTALPRLVHDVGTSDSVRVRMALTVGFGISVLGLAAIHAPFANSAWLDVRSIAVSGYAYALSYGASGGVLAALLLVGTDPIRGTARLKGIWIAAFLAAFIYGSFLGGRAEILTLLIAAIVIYSFRFRPISMRTLSIAGAIGLVVLVGYRVVVRDPHNQANVGLTASQVAASSLRHPFAAAFKSGDVSAFDKLVLLEQRWTGPSLDGSTLLSAVTAPLPKEFFPAKPRGANDVLTNRLYPSLYASRTSLVGASLFGEGFMNFGVIGVPLLASLLGIALVAGYRLAFRGRTYLLLYALLIARVPGFVRGDVFDGVLQLGVAAAMTVLVIGITAWLSPSRERRVVFEAGTSGLAVPELP